MTKAARKPTPKKPAAKKAPSKPTGSKRCQVGMQAGRVVIVDQFELVTDLSPTEARALAQAVLEAAAAAEQRPKRAAKRRG